ncbi:MAG: ATP-grasp domain-containing protein [Myxococcales bacterium]
MPSIVLILPESSYRADDFLSAAARLGLRVITASDRCHVLAEEWTEGSLPLDFTKPESAARKVAEEVKAEAPVAVLGTDDRTAVIAALAASELGLPHNPPAAVEAARNKAQARERLRAAGLPVPWFEVVKRDLPRAELDRLAVRVPYPCVVKALSLSASRGVIRADDSAGFHVAFTRVADLLRSPQIGARRDPETARILVEQFLPGPEVAIEGLLTAGNLSVLAFFDKPDPLDGPYFEETLYVTPSRHPEPLQSACAAAVQEATRALGLVHGPVHAELRLTPDGPRILEVAARSIGGLCGRTLRFGVGIALEELLLRHAIDPASPLPTDRERRAAGVLMLPIRRGGVLQEVRGIESAKSVPGIEDVVITAHLDEEIVPLPEGSSYLGFAFARGDSPAQVEAALREAGSRIEMVVAPKLRVTRG